MGFDWKKALGKIAPLAGTMIGGPWGGLAADAIGKVFGHTGDTPPDEAQMSEYISKATPEQLVQLKSIDSDLKKSMREFDIKEDELVYEDKADARAMQRETRSPMPAAIVILLTIGVFVTMYALFKYPVPEANKALVYSMAGSLMTAWLSSIHFFVGTTKSSQEKTKLMSIR